MEMYSFDREVRRAAGETADPSVHGRPQTNVFQCTFEPREPFDYRAPFGDLLIRLDKETERILQLIESAHRLHQPAERKLAAEEARRCDDRWENPGCLAVACREVGQPLLAPHDVPPIAHDRFKPLAERAQFVRLAAVERYSLGVLAK